MTSKERQKQRVHQSKKTGSVKSSTDIKINQNNKQQIQIDKVNGSVDFQNYQRKKPKPPHVMEEVITLWDSIDILVHYLDSKDTRVFVEIMDIKIRDKSLLKVDSKTRKDILEEVYYQIHRKFGVSDIVNTFDDIWNEYYDIFD